MTMNFVGISQTRTVRNRMQMPMMMMISKKTMYHSKDLNAIIVKITLFFTYFK